MPTTTAVAASSFLLGLALASAVALIALSPKRRPRTTSGPLLDPSPSTANWRQHAKPSDTRTETEAMLWQEQVSRNTQFFGTEGQARIENSRVVVIGLGGVGSHAAHMLARAGVRRLRLVDFDLVTLSSLNRHAVATRRDVGIHKVEAMRNHLGEILGEGALTEIQCMAMMLTKENAESVLEGADYVLDCIDDMATKMDLLEACARRGVRVISSTGAGGKSDPTRLRIGSLSDVTYDPLASRMRARINREGRKIAMDAVETVFSTEDPKVKLLGLSEEQIAHPEEFGAMPSMRLRVMPVLGTSPALFGVAMAARVLTELAAVNTFRPLPVEQISNNLLTTLLQRLRKREGDLWGRPPQSQGVADRVTEAEVALTAAEWRKTCPFTGSKMGSHARLEVGRWRLDRPLDLNNLILARHDVMDAVYVRHVDLLRRAGGERGSTDPDDLEHLLEFAPKERLTSIVRAMEEMNDPERRTMEIGMMIYR